MKRMLFNATHPEELRVAIVDGQSLVDLDIEFVNSENKRGNIYKGKVTKVEPSLEAVFVDYGASRQGFLSLKDISRSYFSDDYSPTTPMAMVKVQDVINVGDTLIVQVEKNERSNKGAALTTFISLAGRYLVLLPSNPRGGGISRQIDGYERKKLKKIISKLDLPAEHSVIARTAGIGQSLDAFNADLAYLINLWKAIEAKADESKAPFLIYEESSLVVRTLRDYLRDDVGQILIDDKSLYKNTNRFVKDVMPNAAAEVLHYKETEPLFSRYQIESQIKDAYSRRVQLPNGGVIVIEQTEALVAIDVNSARSTKGADIEETALQTNLEAVEQVAKQLRLRDIGGLVVVDLIDMSTQKNRRRVEEKLLEAVESDRARTRINRISQFGLLELSRQRMRSSIEESSYDTCPRCRGRGFIRSVTSSSLSILRLIEEEALKANTELIHAHLPVEVVTFLVNEKRQELSMIEKKMGTRIVVIPTKSMLTPDHRIIRFTRADVDKFENVFSYTLKLRDSPPEIYNIVHTSGVDIGTSVERPHLMAAEAKKSAESGIAKFVKKLISPTPPKTDSVSPPETLPVKSTQPQRPPRKHPKSRSGSGNRRKYKSNRYDKRNSNRSRKKSTYKKNYAKSKSAHGNSNNVVDGAAVERRKNSPRPYKGRRRKNSYAARRHPNNSRPNSKNYNRGGRNRKPRKNAARKQVDSHEVRE